MNFHMIYILQFFPLYVYMFQHLMDNPFVLSIQHLENLNLYLIYLFIITMLFSYFKTNNKYLFFFTILIFHEEEILEYQFPFF